MQNNINSAIRDQFVKAGFKDDLPRPKRRLRGEDNTPPSVQRLGRRLIFRENFSPTTPFSFFSHGRLPMVLRNSPILQPLNRAVQLPHHNLSYTSNGANTWERHLCMTARNQIETRLFGRFASWETFMWYLVTGADSMRIASLRTIQTYTSSMLATRTDISAPAFYATVGHVLWDSVISNRELVEQIKTSNLGLDMYFESSKPGTDEKFISRMRGTEWWVALCEIIRSAILDDLIYPQLWTIFPSSSRFSLGRAVPGATIRRGKVSDEDQAAYAAFIELEVQDVARYVSEVNKPEVPVQVQEERQPAKSKAPSAEGHRPAQKPQEEIVRRAPPQRPRRGLAAPVATAGESVQQPTPAAEQAPAFNLQEAPQAHIAERNENPELQNPIVIKYEDGQAPAGDAQPAPEEQSA